GQLAEIERLKAQAAQAAKLEQNVVLFKAVWCGYCRKAMAYLAEKNIAYQAIDIDTAEGALAYAQQGGGQGIPLLLVKGEKTIGFDNETYDAIFMKR
ncbi:MAG: glutaredoxin family protein, partial [Methylococcaceae bacterium]|nr:glutaredoxin family protein [Methylococcaceae bacterium]